MTWNRRINLKYSDLVIRKSPGFGRIGGLKLRQYPSRVILKCQPLKWIRLALKWTMTFEISFSRAHSDTMVCTSLVFQITSIICAVLFANSCIVDYDMCMWSHKILDAFLDRICSYPFVLKTERFWYFSWNAHERFDFHSGAKCIHNHRTSTRILIYLNKDLTSMCPRAALMPWHRSSLLCQHSEKGSIKIDKNEKSWWDIIRFDIYTIVYFDKTLYKL